MIRSLIAERSDISLLRPSESSACFCWKLENSYSQSLLSTLLKFSVKVKIITVYHLHLYKNWIYYACLTFMLYPSCIFAVVGLSSCEQEHLFWLKWKKVKLLKNKIQRDAKNSYTCASIKTWMGIVPVLPWFLSKLMCNRCVDCFSVNVLLEWRHTDFNSNSEKICPTN